MRKFLKTLYFILNNNRNSISYNSDISTDTKIGIRNKIENATIHRSAIANNCLIKEASVFSSEIENDVTLLAKVILFSVKLAHHIQVGNGTSISNTSIKKYTYLAGNNRIFNAKIGAFCSIAENVSIGHAEHPYHQFSTSPLFYKRDNLFNTDKFFQTEINEFKTTFIGNDVWIGYNAFIRSGVKIGNGCVIGTGAIVTRDVAPYSIVAGVPAKKIKARFDNETIQRLEQDRWWDLNDEDLICYAKKNFVDFSTKYNIKNV